MTSLILMAVLGQCARCAQPVAAPPTRVAVAAPADPYGFTNWLNGQRAAYGLPAVGYDPNLSAWAVRNSQAGFGHAVRAGRRQNAGVGPLSTVCVLWMQSPAHRSALLDPYIRRVGIGCWGSVITFNGD